MQPDIFGPGTGTDTSGVLTPGAVGWAVGVAAMAPSLHNSQPWLFHWNGSDLEVHADWSRQLPVIDPDGRQLLLSCGAALFQGALAMRALGRTAEITLADEVGAGIPLACIHGATRDERAPGFEEWALVNAVFERRTTRAMFNARRVPASLLADLTDAVSLEGAHLHVVAEGDTTQVTALAHTLALADRAQRASPHYRRELQEWTRPAGDGTPDGVPQVAAGARRPVPEPEPGEFLQRDFGSDRLWQGPPEHPTIMLLSAEDDQQSLLRAGMALARLLLVATAAGAKASLLNQAVDLAGSREMVRRHTRTPALPQVLLRLGYTDEVAAPTPRRPVTEILMTSDPCTWAPSPR
ncbi:hypothetical protein [Frankia sp. R82]|uniref:Acg family FMN-binding oxidoreductase n=1 Tax=Frankia sp. R82 TaxID=2950553 RepID=UPI00204343E1|nr:hypothetical protein [Frankia sp. R82]MCM3884194.1 hypothetical protein [Frankia sp. R82]